jgi:lipooligosaccharide transport system permease protein
MAAPAVLRVLESHARNYRRTWKGSVFSTFFGPLLYLLAMGMGLGTLVDRGAGPAALGGLSYVEWLAPGLLAATLMQTGAGDSSWPVVAGMKWVRTYHAALATPVGVRDLVGGHLAWVTIRLTMTAVAFALVVLTLGVVGPLAAARAIPPAVLTGLAFAAPVTAYAARLENDTGLSALFRFGIVPMFLFSGTFFPVSQLPDVVEPLAYLVPLWHGVELTRASSLGVPSAFPALAHVAYLAAWVAAGALLADRFFRGRLLR